MKSKVQHNKLEVGIDILSLSWLLLLLALLFALLLLL